MAIDSSALWQYFKFIFGKNRGYVGLGYWSPVDKKDFTEDYFEWPTQAREMFAAIEIKRMSYNVYFCPQLLDERKRSKATIKLCPNVWADLDTCHPDKLLVEPSVVVESSPGRFQAVWVLDEEVDPGIAEDLSRRIAYFHAAHGADRSGWDLSQLLRVPNTPNYKYGDNTFTAPTVKIRTVKQARYRVADFAIYPEVKGTKELTLPFPDKLPEEEPLTLLQRYRFKMNPSVFGLFSTEPENDWSGPLWRLMMYCFEAGMSREEVYVVANSAACNKYARDNKGPEYLWRDICRAWLRNQENVNSVVTSSELDDIISDDELRDVEATPTFVEQYIRWASSVGDAAPQYHEAGAFVILSSLLSGAVKIPTSWGNIIPNLWFMILGVSTLTRKSTSMDMAMDMVNDIDEDILLATDGSIEGLMTAMSMRPGKPSVFLRDEFSGLLEAMTKKDYMAGTAELLTKLYDGKPMKRMLRKEIIDIKRPVLVVFAGGIKSRIQSLLTFEDISSGFIPRFCFLTAESKVSRVKPLGPPSMKDIGEREFIMSRVRYIGEFYNQMVPMVMQGTELKIPTPKQWDAVLTPEAWERYNKLEKDMLEAGVASERAELMVPLYQRLTVSGLKAATLIAASRQQEELVTVEESDIVRGIKYVQGWRAFANDVVNGIGRNTQEKELHKVLQSIMKNPGITRSKLMQNHHLTARSADAVFSTLEQRGQITSSRVSGSQVFHPLLAVGE
jgi:hypothetical protein